MASTAAKVNSRRVRSTQNLNSLSADTAKQGTVLLRNPLPKYSFEKKSKQSKESKNKDAEYSQTTGKEIGQSLNLSGSDCMMANQVPTAQSQRMNESIGSLVNIFPQSFGIPETKIINQEKEQGSKGEHEEGTTKDKPVNKVDPFSTRNGQRSLTQSASDSSLIISQSGESFSSNHAIVNQSGSITASSAASTITMATTAVGENSPGVVGTSVQNVEGVRNQSVVLAASTCCGCKDRVKHLEEEKQMLKNQLEVQLQVNLELKKLLVASVGDDLQHRVERLTRDRALLSQEVGDYTKKMCEGYEHMDQISIQADMWRTKYLACRVMADELASSKAFFSLQFEEAQRALQQLLSERHELRAHLYDTYRGLQQIQEAFDPLKTQGHSVHLLTSKNVLDLARTNQRLTDSVKYRLLPSHVTSVMNCKMEADWTDYLTLAETHALELLTRETRPEDFRYLGRQAIMAPGAVDRFHPCAKYDNLTLNVCCKCKGDISIV